MKIPKSYRIVAFIFLLICLIAIPVTQSQSFTGGFRIGVLDDPDGTLMHGAELAAWQINTTGGVRDSDGNILQLELVAAPVSPDVTMQEAITQLSQMDVRAILGPYTTEMVLDHLLLLQSLSIPILTPALGDTIIVSDATGMLFRIRAAERYQGAALADVLIHDFNLQKVTAVQLDGASTGARVGFSVALSSYTPAPAQIDLLLYEGHTLDDLVIETLQSGSPVVVVFGPPDLASAFYLELRDNGWDGMFAYNRADDVRFRSAVPRSLLNGILGTATWSASFQDDNSIAFLSAYVRAFSVVPDEMAAAGYDAVYMLSQALARSGTLTTNLAAVRDVDGVQGVLNPPGLASREMVRDIAVLRLNHFGGMDVFARYAGEQRLALSDDAAEISERPPSPTPTPEGTILTVKSTFQNVRSGPDTMYDVIGQLPQGEQRQIIGANVDFSWVVIEYRGQQGWLATYLVDTWGDLSDLPLIAAPPTPTPPPSTATPTSQPFPDIVITAASPASIVIGVPTNINVTVMNIGSVSAGTFAVAASFNPGDTFVSAHVPGLGAGMQTIIPLTVTLPDQSGNYEVIIVADLNNEVHEGDAGEANNDDFVFKYHLDRQTIFMNTVTIGVGATFDLEGNVTPVNDIHLTADGLHTVNPTCAAPTNCIGIMGTEWNRAHYRVVRAENGVSTTFIPNSAITQAAIIGVLTAEGRRAVMRVDYFVPGISITLTYRVYQ